MGWFGSSSEQPEKPQEAPATEDGSYRPMKRNERKQCWEARDAFFACLDKNNILDAAKDKDAATRECGKQFDKYRQDCANSWVRCPTLCYSGREGISLLQVSDCHSGPIFHSETGQRQGECGCHQEAGSRGSCRYCRSSKTELEVLVKESF